MDLKIAYCGIDCANCPSYLITQTNDKEAIEKYVIHARKTSARTRPRNRSHAMGAFRLKADDYGNTA